MKTIGKVTLLSAAVLMHCGLADARTQTTNVRNEASNPVHINIEDSPTPSDNIAGLNEGAEKTLPVLVLTETLGDSGRELQAAGASLHSFKDFNLNDFNLNAKAAIVYADVDTLDLSAPDVQAALTLAKLSHWDIILESNEWNSTRVAEFASQISPHLPTKHLQNTTVRIRTSDSKSQAGIEDTSPNKVIQLAGIDAAKLEAGRNAELASTPKARHASSFLANFAKRAYEDQPASYFVNPVNNGAYVLLLGRDVVKVWAGQDPVTNEYFEPTPVLPNGPVVQNICVVAWRGSTFDGFAGDWARNAENQWGPRQPAPTNQSGDPARVGKGYAERLKNQRAFVAGVLDEYNCGRVHVTGHSLGGGMAHLHAYTLRFFNVARVETYNPSRVGNWEFVLDYQWSLQQKTRVFCTHGDPVHAFPTGLHHVGMHTNNQHGCDFWRARRSSWNLIANHALEQWL